MAEYTPLQELLRPVLEQALGGGVEYVDLDDSVIEDIMSGLLSAPIPTRLAVVLFLGGSLSLELAAGIKATYGNHRFALEWPADTMESAEMVDAESEEMA